MSIQISLKKSTTNPTGSSGLTLGEPVFNYGNNTLWMGLGGTTTPVWIGAGVCGASGGIAAGLTYQIPTLGAVKDYFSAVSSAFLGTTASYVISFNGNTGAVQGVSSAAAGTGISVSAATGAITITNIGVQTFNGLTGAVTGVTVGGANTFTALNSFGSGISAAGGTFSALTRFNGGITTSTLYVSGNATVNGTLTTPSIVGNPITINSVSGSCTIGDVSGAWNGTTLVVDDNATDISLNSSTVHLNGSVTTNTSITSPVYIDNYSKIQTSQTTTTAITANQTIATFDGIYDTGMNYPAFEVTITARDTVDNKTEMLKMLVVHDGTNTVNTQYGMVRTGTAVTSSYITTITGSITKNLLIRATPSSANSTNFTVTIRAHNG